MGDLLTLDLEQKAIAVREQLAAAVQKFGRVVYSNSLGAEAMVLTDIIWSHVPAIDICTRRPTRFWRRSRGAISGKSGSSIRIPRLWKPWSPIGA